MLTNYARYLTTARATVNCRGRQVTPAELFSVAKRQTDYILGTNPRGLSYMMRFGTTPKQPHHRSSSLPSIRAQPAKIGCKQGLDFFSLPNPNINVPTGAIIGGPDINDNINDNRGNRRWSPRRT